MISKEEVKHWKDRGVSPQSLRGLAGLRDEAKGYIRRKREYLRKARLKDAGMSTTDYAHLLSRLTEMYAQVHKALGGHIIDDLRKDDIAKKLDSRGPVA